MAVDTANKRASCLSLTVQNLGHVWPVPDASFDQGDRQQIGFIYRGILAVNPVAVTWFNGLTTNIRLTGAGQA